MKRLTAGAVAFGAVVAWASPATAEFPQTQLINQKIAEGYKAADIKKPAAKCDDHEFIRRVFIDLLGRIATPEEVIDFEQDTAPNKRAKLVNRLLNSTEYTPKIAGKPVSVPGPGGKPKALTFDYADEYADHWANLWTVWLTSRTVHPGYREQMHLWLYDHFYKNTSYKEMVHQLLTASGKTNENGAVNFIIHHIGDPNPQDKRAELGPFDNVPITSRVTRLFLGLQTQCTQCHDHPFNKEWIQSDFWGVNAYLRQAVREGTPTPRVARNNQNPTLAVIGLVDNPGNNSSSIVYYERRDGKLMAAKPNFLKDLAQAEKGESPNKTMKDHGGKSRREAMSAYVTAHDNFAAAYINRIWGHLFGRGLNKEPAVDDFGSHNPVTHPEMLSELSKQFAEYQYNPKALLEWICTSDAYQLSSTTNKDYVDMKYDPYFARMPLKAMTPESLFSAIMTATKAEFAANKDDKKQQMDRWMGKLVQNFGDDEGNEMTFNGTIIQALLMMNGKEINDEVSGRGNNVVSQVVARNSKAGGVNVDGVLDELFLMTLNRRPEAAEKTKIKTLMARGAVVPRDAADPTPKPTTPGGPPGSLPPGVKPPAKGPIPKGPNRPAPVTPGIVAPTNPSDVTFYQDVFWALLNTNEFMLNH